MASVLKAAFIDRDGVINRERNYLFRTRDFEFLPGAVLGLRQLSDQGYLLAVVTNQSGIGRGLYCFEFRRGRGWGFAGGQQGASQHDRDDHDSSIQHALSILRGVNEREHYTPLVWAGTFFV